jgi:hypothetical protein
VKRAPISPFSAVADTSKHCAVTRVLSRKINTRSNGDNNRYEKVLDFSPPCFCCHAPFKNHLGTFDLAET